MAISVPTSAFADEWVRLVRGLESASERLGRELAECGRLTAAALGRAEIPTGDLQDHAGDDEMSNFVRTRGAEGRARLLNPMRELDRRQPLRQALAALDAYRTNLGELARRTPAAVRARGTDLAAVPERAGTNSLALRIASRRSREKTVPLRTALQRALYRIEKRQQAIEGRFVTELLRSIYDLRENWRLTRVELDRAAAGEPPTDPTQLEASRKSPVGGVTRATEGMMNGLRALAAELSGAVAEEAATGFLLGSLSTPRSHRRARAVHLEYWSAQVGSMEREMQLESDLFEGEQRILSTALGACRSIERERETLLRSVDDLSTWLSARLASPPAGPSAPPRPPVVVPAMSRSNGLSSEVRTVARSLPHELGLIRRLRETSGRRLSWKVLRPADLAIEAFEGVAQSGIERLFSGIEAEHLAMFREVERALQVVEYGTTELGVDEGTDDAVEREALENARGLLRVEKETVDSSVDHDRRRMIGLLASFFEEYRGLLVRSRLGALAHLGSLDVRNVAAVAADSVWRWLLRAGGSLSRLGPYLAKRFLIAIQWLPPEETVGSDVTRRPYLPREFTLDVRSRDLPKIYRRLFRFEAVEDPRFLIGREEELQAITEARQLWEDQRPVAVLVVGARGSGKTSLINCAIQGCLDGLEIYRGEVRERVMDAPGIRAIVADVVGVNDPTRLEEELANRRGVIVLEELERAFLREIGGFAAVRELQRLIAATCGSMLWIVACNQRAFSLLNRAVNLADGFSHRIDAASVSREALRQAILVRHNLSGLRLRFLVSPGRRPAFERLTARLRRRRDPEALFFERLAEESGGVFRTAFELWLGQVGTIRAGVLDVQPLTEPDIGDLIDELDQYDLFSLVATMQHGSLTPEEHARVFQQRPAQSRAELDELLSRELIEPDPLRPGARIRPSANRVAREALHRHNLG